MKIFVLGHKGMLGRYVSTYLNQFYKVINVGRNEINAANTNHIELDFELYNLGFQKGDVVINCIGTIKPMIDKLGELNAIQVNSVFPRILADVVEAKKGFMIHPTTDCVYSGKKGNYTEDDGYDVNDVYGMTKALGEPKNCTVIRTSIIGEEVGQGRSLVEWIKSNRNSTVNGYKNHIWNGITCLEFAKICKKMIDENKFWKGTRHLFSNNLSKLELVQTISDVYNLNLTVTPIDAPTKCDRTLLTINWECLGWANSPDLSTQIIEMKNYAKTLYGN